MYVCLYICVYVCVCVYIYKLGHCAIYELVCSKSTRF